MMNTSVKAIHCFLGVYFERKQTINAKFINQKIATSLTSPLTCPGFMLVNLFESL